jgi:hypothetical protein
LAKVSFPLDGKEWAPVRFPHNFSRVQPAPNVFGWYARQIVVPAAYKGLDLFLDLGLIDDADVTYVNGKEIGRKGDLDNKVLSAWNVHRRYVCPRELVRFGQTNTLAVQVKNFTGLGGLLGQPWIGASLVVSHKARFAEGDLPAAEASQAAFDDTRWTEIVLPDEEWAKRISKRPAYGWYRIRFDVPDSLAGMDLLLDLGMVYDAAAAYLNGKLIGQCGRFPPDFFPQTAGRLRCIAPAQLIQPKANVLAIRVYNEDQFGGIVGLPSIDFELGERLIGYGKSAKEWAASLPKAFDLPLVPGLAFDLSEFLIHSGRLDEGLALTAQCAEKPGGIAQDRQKARARAVYALHLNGKTDEAWLRFQKLDFGQPIPFEAAYSASAICRQEGFAPARLAYLGPDTSTGPDWDLHYGTESVVLCAMHAPFSFHWGGTPTGFSATTGDAGRQPASWLGKTATEDRRALFHPLSKKLRYAAWDDLGGIHPCDDAGPDLLIRYPISEGNHLLTFYLVDFDWCAGQHPRLQSFILLDEGQRPLFALGTGRFGQGRYERFLVEGPLVLTIRISKHRSASTILSGIFLDRVVPLQPFPPRLPKATGADQGLSRRYEALAAQSAKSLVQTLRAPELGVFGTDCRKLAQEKDVSAETLWWLSELERVRARQKEHVVCLHRVLDILAPKGAPDHEQTAIERVGPLGPFLEAQGYCNADLLLCVERYTASVPKRRAMYLRNLRRGSLDWRADPGQQK